MFVYAAVFIYRESERECMHDGMVIIRLLILETFVLLSEAYLMTSLELSVYL